MLAYAKAGVAAAISFLTALSQALIDGTISAQDWITAAIAALVAFSVVWAVPNKRA